MTLLPTRDGSGASPTGYLATVGSVLRMLPPSLRRRWLLVVPLGVVNAALELGGAFMIVGLIDVVTSPERAESVLVARQLREIFPGASDDRLLVLFAAAVGLYYLLKNCSLLLEAFLQASLANAAAARVSERLLRGYCRAPWPFHFQHDTAELIRNVTVSTDVAFRSVLLAGSMLVSDSLVVLAIVGVLLVSAPVVTPLAAATLGLLLFALFRVMNGPLRRWGEDSQGLSRTALEAVQQCLGAVKELKVLGREQFFVNRFRASREQLEVVYRRSATALQIPRLAMETVFVAVMVLVIAVVALQSGDRSKVVPLLGLYAYVGFRLLPSLSRMSNGLNNIRFGAPAVELLARDAADLEDALDPDHHPTPRLPFDRELVIDGVSYSYPGTDILVLDDIHISIPQGDTVGIVGATGSGKSTLADLVMGLLQPTAGRILVDGRDVSSAVDGWQRNIGYVAQSSFLTNDSLRSNVALGVDVEDIDEARLEQAIRLAQLDDVVAELPDGLDTIVGELGQRLSGGQRQRVAIARALYHEPDVLVFDEATSALDNRTERAVSQAIEMLGGARTILVIAHRMTSVRHCHQIVFLDKGRLVDVGGFDALLERHETFRELAGQAGPSSGDT